MTPFILPEAAADIHRQIERYADQGLPAIARRFHGAVLTSLDALIARPETGQERMTGDPAPPGLRAWPVKGFDAFWIYYLHEPARLTVLRVLHDKRDIGIVVEAGNSGTP
jgi:plasmid stabilization system protein ParE